MGGSILRGVFYAFGAAIPVVALSFEKWSRTPPENKYEVGAVLLAAIAAGYTALRGFLDQHLSRTESAKGVTTT